MRKRKRFAALYALLRPVLALTILTVFLLALTRLDDGRQEEGRAVLEDAVRRAAAACYAAEGIYPPDIAYLEKYYGIQVDHDRYAVFYEVFGSNLMPEITVVSVQ